jgi:sulfur-carrier protein adenylyltransferase/sulfurtransferase
MLAGMPVVSRDELIKRTMASIRELSVEDVRARLDDSSRPVLLLDVREPEEVATGQLPGSVVVARGWLEFQIEKLARDRNTEIIVYCAAGLRSALAVKTLQDMGYNRVSSMAGGYALWKGRGFPWVVDNPLTADQQVRYSRQITLPEVDEAGQKTLLKSRVLLIGAGGLGSPTALYLAAAGVGTIGVVDPDVVDKSNLHRQILHRELDVGTPKVDSAERAMTELNPDVKVIKYKERLSSQNVLGIFDEGWNVIIDGCDNFPTRYLVNDACVFRKIPNVHGSIFRFEGQVSVFAPKLGGPCYRCLYPEPPPPGLAPSCAEAGVLGALPGIIGTMQAIEGMKLILGAGRTLVGRLLQYDALEQSWRELKLRKDANCPVCSEKPTITELIDYDAWCSLHGA